MFISHPTPIWLGNRQVSALRTNSNSFLDSIQIFYQAPLQDPLSHLAYVSIVSIIILFLYIIYLSFLCEMLLDNRLWGSRVLGSSCAPYSSLLRYLGLSNHVQIGTCDCSEQSRVHLFLRRPNAHW